MDTKQNRKIHIYTSVNMFSVPLLSVLLSTAAYCFASTCPELSQRWRQHDRLSSRRHDTLFVSIWLLEPNRPFGTTCCGGLFSCSDRSATCLQCGNSHCSSLAIGQPGCRSGDVCIPFGMVCDGHDDCGDVDSVRSSDERQCDVILNSFSVERRQSFDQGQIVLHGVSVETCAAICFFHESCPLFSYAQFPSLEHLTIEPLQSSLGRRLYKSACKIGCTECGLMPHFNASGDIYRVTRETQALRLSLIGSPQQTTAVKSVHLAFGEDLPRWPHCGRARQEVAQFGRIVDGASTEYGQFPWQAQIRQLAVRNNQRPRHLCGGVVITNHFVLTAAHCMTLGENSYEVVVGQYDLSRVDAYEQVFAIQARIIHPDYDPVTKINDICLIRINSRRGPITFNSKVRPACMPDVQQLQRPPAALSLEPVSASGAPVECLVSGWGDGRRVPPLLHSFALPLVSAGFCASAEVYGAAFVADAMLCAGFVAGGADSCQGDSGGGLVCWSESERDDSRQHRHLVLTGLVSKGGRCGAANRPGVYTSMYHHSQWVQRMMAVLRGH